MEGKSKAGPHVASDRHLANQRSGPAAAVEALLRRLFRSRFRLRTGIQDLDVGS